LIALTIPKLIADDPGEADLKSGHHASAMGSCFLILRVGSSRAMDSKAR
jgi:hypothetical protein